SLAAAMAAARESIEAEAADKAREAVEARARDRGDDDVTGAGDAAPAAAEPKPTAQRNFTDPDARIMKTVDGYFHYCY
ncbi:IS5/IS1182 family transposase, partial [Escherichia coli]|nr:IS5/IS1182 family transposase [Escherichia coli]